MNEHDDLHRLLTSAVDHVEPADRLSEIRSRTRATSRRQWYVAGGAVLATAAAVTAVAVVSSTLGGAPTTEDPAGPSSSAPVPPPEIAEAVADGYYLGDTARGPRLFLERRPVPAGSELEMAVAFLETEPVDPDYRTPWNAGSFGSARGSADVLEIELTDAVLRERPEGLDEAEAGVAVEQVVRTLQLAAGSDAPVQFRFEGNPIDQVLGVPTSEPLSPAPLTETLSLMSVEFPQEGEVVSGELVARGLNNGNEATMNWSVEQDGEVLLEGFATALGWMEERLWPWETEPIDLSGLAPGTYTFVATNPDPSGGEGFAPDRDTKTIRVEEAAPAPTGAVTPVYYVGDGPDGPDAPEHVLYREFGRAVAKDPLNAAIELLQSTPADPDYTTLWPKASLEFGSFDGIGDQGFISVVLTDPALVERPSPMNEAEARLAIQQVVYTMQAALRTRAPVEFSLPGATSNVDTVLGVPAERDAEFSGVRKYTEAPVLDVLSHMVISDPAEGLVVSDDSFTARGLGTGFEGSLVCFVRDGDRQLWAEPTIAGWQEERLFPWELEVDLSDVPSGTYTFLCTTDDPTGGTEGRGADTDTRTIVVE